MFEGLCPDTGGPLLEFGPGTGAFTVKVDGWRRKGIRVPYLGIERDRGLYERLVRRFPGLDFVLGDVVDAADICAERRFPPAAAVISGLPLILMSQSALAAVLDNTRHCMAPLGVFRAFSYLHCYRTQRASRLRHHLAELFEDSRASAFVFSNVPPAVVLEGRRPRRTIGAPGVRRRSIRVRLAGRDTWPSQGDSTGLARAAMAEQPER